MSSVPKDAFYEHPPIRRLLLLLGFARDVKWADLPESLKMGNAYPHIGLTVVLLRAILPLDQGCGVGDTQAGFPSSYPVFIVAPLRFLSLSVGGSWV